MVDHGLTKGVILCPTKKTIDASGIVSLFFSKVFKRFGVYDKIISDCGPQFTSVFAKELGKLLGYELALSTAYHPQTNGETKLVNQEIETYLWIFCGTNPASCCTCSARHGTLFPFPVLTFNFRLRADGCCRSVQARLCRKHCGHVISLGPYLLSMTSSPSSLVAVTGFSSFHFRFAPSDKCTFCHSSLVTLYPAPLLPLDDNGSIAWSVRALVRYI